MNYEYYNQLIEYYCPGILAYIYKRTTDVEHGLLASLFKLEQKNKIKIYEDRIEILEKDYTNVTHMEEYMMRSIEHGFVSMKIDKLEFGYREEALKKQLFTEDEFAISAETAMLIIMLPILATILLFTENKSEDTALTNCIGLSFSLLSISLKYTVTLSASFSSGSIIEGL